jgi:hypothetical protein
VPTTLSANPPLPSGCRQRGSGILQHPLAALLLCSALTALGHAFLLGDWNPFLSADTYWFYGPTLTLLNQPEGPSYSALFVRPFFLPQDQVSRPEEPRADEAKPVFVCALRLWHLGWKRWVRPDLVLPDPFAYEAFVITTCALAFLTLGLLGWKLGHPWIGIVTGFAVFWTPWGLTTCYFTTYTAFSLVLFCGALLLLLFRPASASLAAGILIALCLLSNQSLLACLPSLPLLILFHQGKEGRWKAATALIAFGLGIVLPFAILESLGETSWVQGLMGSTAIQKPLGILKLYLDRSRNERLQWLPAFDRSFFLTLSLLNSRVLSAAGLGIMLIFASAVLHWTLEGGVARLRRKLVDPAVKQGLLTLLPALSALLVIDGREGFKFSRSYFLALPFLVLGLSQFGFFLVRNLPRRLVRNGVACLLLLGCAEGVYRVRDFYQAFQGVPHFLQALADHPDRVAALQQDKYSPFFAAMAPIASIDAGHPIPDRVEYLVTGLPFESALDHTGGQMNVEGYLWRHRQQLVLDREVPFLALYPFIVHEDPYATFAMRIGHQFDHRAYRNWRGTVKIWRHMRSDVDGVAGGTDPTNDSSLVRK